MSTLIMNHNLDFVRETPNVDPARPMNLDEQVQGSENYFGSTVTRKHSSGVEIDDLVHTWTENAKRVADGAIATSKLHPESAAAFARAAFALLAVGQIEPARVSAHRAISIAKSQASDSRPLDVPIIVGSMRVLSAMEETPVLISLLDGLPRVPYLVRLKASLIAAMGDLESALALLDDFPDGDALSLEGYLWLQKNNLDRAIRLLRAATTHNVKDIDAHFNLAIAMYRNGSLKKALRSVKVAHELSPGRLDIRHFYLELLAKTGNLDVLKIEVERLRSSNADDTTEIQVAEARICLAKGQRDRAQVHLERAEKLALDRGDIQLASELKGNRIMLKHAAHKISRITAKREILTLLQSVPDSVLLAQMLSMLIVRRSEVKLLEPYLSRHEDSMSSIAYSLRAQTAYLECRFEDYLHEVRRWVKSCPNDGDALLTLMAAEGRFDDDWSRAADVAKKGLKKMPRSVYLVNQAAYVFALAGQPQIAERVLESAPEWNYALEATRGLVKIYLGNIEGGLKNYRKAAEMVEKAPDTENDAILMSIYQGLALRRLNLITPENEKLLKAAALPAVSLPQDWDDFPAFLSLKSSADRNGWEWPPLLD